MKKIMGLLVALLFNISVWATDPYPKNNSIDISHYHFLFRGK